MQLQLIFLQNLQLWDISSKFPTVISSKFPTVIPSGISTRIPPVYFHIIYPVIPADGLYSGISDGMRPELLRFLGYLKDT